MTPLGADLRDVPSANGLLDALRDHFTEGRAQETGLQLTPEGFLYWDIEDLLS